MELFDVISEVLKGKKPLVSVCMITYNHEDYIREAIESVACQETNFDFELIVGEDCSDDSTRTICLEMQEKYSHVVRVVYSNRNVGMRANGKRIRDLCRGRFVAFCEGDDYWCDRNKLQSQYDFLISNPECAMVYHETLKLNPSGEFAKDALKPKFKYVECFGIETLLSESTGIHTSSVFVTAESISNLPQWYMEASVGDIPTRLVVATRGKIGYINKPMSVRRMWVPGSWTERANEPVFEQRKKRYLSTVKMWNDFDEWTGYKYKKLLIPKKRRLYKKLVRAWVSCQISRLGF